MTDYLHALPPGYRIEEYELVRVLGSGGFGITYLGYDHHLDKAVAIKEYLPNDLAVRTDNNSVLPKSTQDKADYEWGLARFLNEAQTLARFDHRHIIKIHRFFRAHGTGYSVMEYAEGETLSEMLQRKGALTEPELKAILFPILDGLEAVHEADFLHRDIKPSNIVIRDDGSPVLIDFGSARQAVAGKSRSVTAIVTPGYAPVEQYSVKGHQGPWTDIYGLGAVCYRCLTGEPPVDATERLREDPLVPAAQRCKGKASASLMGAIDRALRVNEGERPQTIAEWRKMLSDKTATPAYLKRKERKKQNARPFSSPAQGRKDIKPLLAVVILILVGLQLVYEDGKEEADPREVLRPSDERIRFTPGYSIRGADSSASDDYERGEDAYYGGEYLEAVRWYRRAAEQGDQMAKFMLSTMYAYGEGVQQDDSEAMKWYRKAVEQRHVTASSYITTVYDAKDEIVTDDDAEAARWFHREAEQGDAVAQVNLGVMYNKGVGVTQDDAEAVRWYRQAAEQEDALAQFNLGVMYDKGEGVAEDDTEAARWYRLAAEQEDAQAQFNLGVMYDKGEGVAEDNAEAVRWYRRVAEMGNHEAQFMLAVMYASGEGVLQDYVAAYMWFNIAKSTGGLDVMQDMAMKARDNIAKRMTALNISEAQRRARICLESDYKDCD